MAPCIALRWLLKLRFFLVALFAFFAFTHRPKTFFTTLGAISSALHQLGTDEFEYHLLGTIALSPAQLHDSGVATVPLAEASAKFIEKLLDGVLGPQESRSLTTRVQGITLCQGNHLINERLDRLCFGTGVIMRSCSMTLVTMVRNSPTR